MAQSLVFFVNGTKVVEDNPDPEWTLAYYLRNKLSLKGTKMSCGEGQCGSCTAMVSKYQECNKRVKHCSVNACLVPVVALHGCAVTTIEGIGSISKGLHPLQERLPMRHGSQCGFCSPGFVMSMYALLRNNPNPTKEEVERAIQGNWCRCTGYRPILEAFYSFSDKKCPCGFQGDCCQANPDVKSKESVLSSWSHLRPYDASQDPIFPPELVGLPKRDLHFIGPRVTWFCPTNVKSLLEYINTNGDATIVASGAWTGLQERLTNNPQRNLLNIEAVDEFRKVADAQNELIIGAGLSITEMEKAFQKNSTIQPSKVTDMFLQATPLLGYQQLRNFVSWVGNVASGWYISDLSICSMVSGCSLCVLDKTGKNRQVKLDNEFYVDQFKVKLSKQDVVTALHVPLHQDENGTFVECFHSKQGQRHGPDSAIVNGAAMFVVDKQSKKIKEARFAFGGVANRPYLVAVKGGDCDANDENRSKIMKQVEEELKKVLNKAAGKNEYRLTLAVSFVFKFFTSLQQKLTGQTLTFASRPFEPVTSIQFVPEVVSGQPAYDTVGRPLVHNAGQKHCTGESIFCDDIGTQPHECHLALVISERAHARILHVDCTDALSVPGVIAWVDDKDIPSKGTNTPALPFWGDQVFWRNEVQAFGQAIGGIIAEDPMLARRAAKLVKVVYEDLHVVANMDQAIESKSVFDPMFKETKGDIESGMSQSEHVVSGTARLDGQEHFYMEPIGCLVVPKDGDEYEIFSTTQMPSWIQMHVSAAIGVPANKIVVKVKRIGGAFGGKCDQSGKAVWPAVVAAHKLKRPIRCVFTRQEDMTITAKRPPFLCKYDVGFKNDGTITGLRGSVFLDAGCMAAFCSFISMHSISNFDSAYNINNMALDATTLHTNLPYNTMMRGAGQPEAHFLMESIIEKVADSLKMEPEIIRRKHLYKNGDKSICGIIMEDCNVIQCWEECARISQYELRKKEVEAFNKSNVYKKRGISMITVKTGVGATDMQFDQGTVLVHIYLDGTVQLSHGGIEMGQGLNTKIIQVASRVLKVPAENITTIETGTDKVANGMPTGGSVGTDVYGPATKQACEELLERLQPFIFKNPKGNFPEWVQAAHDARVHLTAVGHGTPKVDNPDGHRTGHPRYYVFGVGCSEVEVDCLTGDHVVLQSDLVMDLGQTLNPAIDVGQIEGGFTQGYGLVTMEELQYDSNGQLLSNSAMKYKIPNVSTTPKKFRVMLLKDGQCKGNIFSSKGVGEPPLTLGFSIFFAIKKAIKAAREQFGITEPLDMNSPATPERIRLLCPKLQ